MRSSPSAPTSKRSPGQISVVEPYSSIKAGPWPEKPVRQGGAVEDVGVERAGAAEIDRAPPRRCIAALRARQPLQLRPPQPRECGEMQRLEFGVGAGIGVAVAPFVVAVERGADGVWIGGVGQRHLDVVALADIAHFAEALEQHFAGAEVAHQRGARFFFHVGEGVLQGGDGRVVEPSGEGLRHVEPRVGEQHADGGEISGLGRDHHGGDRKLSCQCACMQRPAAAIAEQHEFARIAAVLDRNLLDRARHDDGGERDDPVRHARHAVGAGISERLPDLLHGLARGRGIELQLAAEEAIGVEPAEHEIGVGHRRLGAAIAIAGGAGRRARALRADRQAVLRIEPGDRAAAGADLDDVDHRRLDRKPFHIAAGVVDRVDREAAVLDQRALGGGAAHVEGDDVLQAQRLGIGAGADAAADRTGFHEAHWLPAGALDRKQAAVRAHHIKRAGKALAGEVALEPPDIGRDLRADIGVGGDRRGALVFVPFARQLGGAGDVDARQQRAQRRGGLFLVRRVGVGVHEEDRDRFDAERFDLAGERRQRGGVERRDDLALAADALGHLEPQRARDQRLVAAIVQVERVGPVAARDFEHVAKARRRDEGRLGALALDQRIDDERGAVVDETRLVRRELHLVEAVEDAFDEISVGRRALGVGDAVVLVVVRNEISEGTADIDGDGKGHFLRSHAVAARSIPRIAAADQWA